MYLKIWKIKSNFLSHLHEKALKHSYLNESLRKNIIYDVEPKPFSFLFGTARLLTRLVLRLQHKHTADKLMFGPARLRVRELESVNFH